MNKKIAKLLKLIDDFGFQNEVQITATKNGVITHQTLWMKNKVVSSANNGRNLALQSLSGDYTGSMEITHCEFGTGTTAATDADTNTEAGAVRAAKSYVSVSAGVMTIKFFFSDATLPDDDYTELTMWIDGTASEGTGHLFNRLVFASTPYTKSAGEDSRVEIRVTLAG